MKKIITLLIALCIVLGCVTTPPFATLADEKREFDSVDVLDDLTSSKDENGNAFDLTDYPYDENGRVRLVTLAEYCYSYAENMRGNYALYLYLYNPTGREIDTASPLNQAQFAVSYNAEGKTSAFEKFDLHFCNKSTGDYNNLFYKFRVIDHESADGKTMGERVNSNIRRYDLSGVELLTKGEVNATEYGCGGTYKYSGYAQGYGPDDTAESTLKCEVTDLETIETTVHGTVYRPDGGFHQGEQDQLSSVFFSVPDYFFTEYGEISSITAQWYEYKTNPIFVTENAARAAIFDNFVGKDITETGFTGSIGAWEDQEQIGGLIRDVYAWVYNADMGVIGSLGEDIPRKYLTAVFDTMGVDFEEFTVSEGQLKKALLDYSARLGGELINGKYSAALFSDEAEAGHIRGERKVKIDSDAMFSLTSYKLTQNFWQQIFGGSSIEITTYKDIQAIITVKEDDLKGEPSEISKRLYIGESEVEALKAEYAAAKASGKRVVLFRYAAGKYYAYPAVYNLNNEKPSSGGYEVFRDGYVAEQTVYLDFDLIETTFYKEGVYTVIPVVSSPIDILGPVTPSLPDDPIRSGCADSSAWGMSLTLLLIIVALILITWVLTSIIKTIGGKQSVSVTYMPPEQEKAKPPKDNARRSELAAGRAEKSARQAKKSAASAKEIEREVKANGGKKMPNKTGGTKSSAPHGKTGNAGGKAPKQNTDARNGKVVGKTKSTPSKGKDVRKGS